jgi:hypothetical protein
MATEARVSGEAEMVTDLLRESQSIGEFVVEVLWGFVVGGV